MIGLQGLHHIDRRLRQIYQEPDQPFGGIHVVLFGDFAQLPPVLDTAFYTPHGRIQNRSTKVIAGKGIYDLFTSTITLVQMMRQQGNSAEDVHFRDILAQLRQGPITRDGWLFLLNRTLDRLPLDERRSFAPAIRLYPTKSMVNAFNLDRLRQLDVPVLRIKAINKGTGASDADMEDAGRLEKELFLCRYARVMLTYNLNIGQGLVNGSMGTIFAFLWNEGVQNPRDTMPAYVLINFDGYTGPMAVDIDGTFYVPIAPRMQQFDVQSKVCQRTQFPLMLSAAVTIHKSQGMTLDKAVLNLTDKDHTPGLTYVAISRVRRINDLAFEGALHYDRFPRSIPESVLGRNEDARRRQQQNQIHTWQRIHYS